tara:strand:+ start:25554 stop:25715 length:162 start_codon:yes stop_codon:yes gene_type:complete
MRHVHEEKITPEKAIELLNEEHIKVSREQAEIILKFFYGMAEIVVDQYLSDYP